MKTELILLGAIFSIFFGTTTGDCTQAQSFDQSWPSNLGLNVVGPNICYKDYLCVWKFEFMTADGTTVPSVTLNFKPAFNGSFFYTLSSNGLLMDSAQPIYLEIPQPSTIGEYNLQVQIDGPGISFTSCHSFSVTKVVPPSISRFGIDSAALTQRLADYSQVIQNFNPQPSTRCGSTFNMLDELDFSNYDMLMANTVLQFFGVVTANCLEDLRTRFETYLQTDLPYFDTTADWYYSHIFADGFSWYKNLIDSDYVPEPALSTWVSSLPKSQFGAPDWILNHAQYVNSIILRMALTGKMDTKIPRQVSLLMNAVQNMLKTDMSVADVLYYALLPLRPLYNWHYLTKDTRVLILARQVLDRAGQNITNDYKVAYPGGINSNYAQFFAQAYAGYYAVSGDTAMGNVAIYLTNDSIFNAYDGTPKHVNQKINANYDALMLIANASIAFPNSRIAFEFPIISSGTNSTTILPNQTLEITSSVTIVGDLVVNPESTVKISDGQVLNITGCAVLSGTLVVNVEDGLLDNNTVLIQYSCRQGEFDNLEVVGGDDNPCLRYSLEYTPTAMNVAVTSICTEDPFPWWAILTLVLGAAALAGVGIGVGLGLRKKQQDQASADLNSRLRTGSAKSGGSSLLNGIA